MVNGFAERGQLILVGALVMALLIVGMTIIVNTVLFVENTPTDQSTTELRQVSQTEGELREAARLTTFRVNHRTRNRTESELAGSVERNVRNLTQGLDQQYLATRSLSVEITILETENGTRVVQSGDSEFTRPSTGDTDWDPVTTPARIGWFTLNLNSTNSQSKPFEIEVSNSTTGDVTYNITRTNDSAYRIKSDVSSGGDADVTCITRENRLVLDMRLGQSPTDRSCAFNGTIEIGNASAVQFRDSHRAFGKYAIVVNGTGNPPPNVDSAIGECSSTPLTEPCHTPVVWSMRIETGLTSESVSRTASHNLTVYPVGAGS